MNIHPVYCTEVLKRSLGPTPRADISDNQFGFRESRGIIFTYYIGPISTHLCRIVSQISSSSLLLSHFGADKSMMHVTYICILKVRI